MRNGRITETPLFVPKPALRETCFSATDLIFAVKRHQVTQRSFKCQTDDFSNSEFRSDGDRLTVRTQNQNWSKATSRTLNLPKSRTVSVLQTRPQLVGSSAGRCAPSSDFGLATVEMIGNRRCCRGVIRLAVIDQAELRSAESVAVGSSSG